MKQIILKEEVLTDFTYLLGKDIVKIEPVNVGIMNYIFRAATKDRDIYYFKQALREPRMKDLITLNANFIQQDRIKSEYECLLVLGKEKNYGINFLIPEPILFDEVNNILITKDLIMQTSLQTELEKGVFDDNVAEILGSYLKFQHSIKLSDTFSVCKSTSDGDHWQYFLALRTLDLLNNREFHVLKDDIRSIYAKGIAISKKQLMHVDFCPKNILVGNKNIAILDFEMASSIGDPAYDLGFMIGHYLLYGFITKNAKKGFQASNAMYNSYVENVYDIPQDFQTRVWRYAGCTILYRLKGASPIQSINPLISEELKLEGMELVRNGHILAR